MLHQVGLYKHSTEDFGLIIRVLSEFKGGNLPEYLCLRRERSGGIIKGDKFFERLKKILILRVKAIRELDIPFWRWPQIIVPAIGFILFKLGFDKEIGHQLVSDGFLDTLKSYLH